MADLTPAALQTKFFRRSLSLLRELVEDRDDHIAAIADGSLIEVDGDAEAWFSAACDLIREWDALVVSSRRQQDEEEKKNDDQVSRVDGE